MGGLEPVVAEMLRNASGAAMRTMMIQDLIDLSSPEMSPEPAEGWNLRNLAHQPGYHHLLSAEDHRADFRYLNQA